MAQPKNKQVFDVGRTLPNRDKNQVPPGKPGAAALPAEKPEGNLWKRIALALVLLIIAVFLIIAGWDLVNISRASKKAFGSANLFSLLSSPGLKGANSGRVNVLLVGYSVDDPGHPGASLTDSIMILSLSTSNHTGYMLSIPRDLYVAIPGYGHAKINEAYRDGGMPLLEQVVSQDFNVPLNYYALVDYAAVRDTVNALGGVWVDIQSPDPRGLYDPNISYADGGPLKLANGWQKLNGQTALNLTRARGDPASDGRLPYGFPQSDFDRTQHQRQILAAIQGELGWKLILNPLKNGRLFQAVGNNVKTDLRLGEVKPLFGLFHRVPSDQLKSYSLRNINGKNYLVSSYYEGDTLSPAAGADNYSQIDAAINQLNQ